MAKFTSTESLGASTSVSSTPTNKVTHTITSPTGKSYIIFFIADTNVSNTATRCKVDLIVDGATIATFSPKFFNNAEDHNVFFFEKVTGKTANFDCKIDFSSTDNTNTATISNARIVAWEYSAWSGLDLQYASDNTNRALPASFDTNGATISFTPSSTGNYFVLGCGGIAPNSTTISSIMRLEVDSSLFPFATDTNAYWSREAPATVTDAFHNFNVGTRQNLSGTGTRTLRISARNESGTTGTWQYTRVLCFREDAFTTSNYQEVNTAAEQTTTSTTYQAVGSATTATPSAAKDYLIIVCNQLGQNFDTAEAERTQGRVLVAGAEVQMAEFRPKEISSPGDYISLGHASVRNDSAAFTVATQFRMQNVFDNTATTKNSFILILRDDIATGQNYTQNLSEAVVLVDSRAMQTGKPLSEVLAIVDSFSRAWTALRTFDEAVVIADAIQKQAQKIFSEALALIDNLATLFGKVFSETIVLADSIAKATTKLQAETIVIADSIAKSATRVFNEALVIADSIAKTTSRAFSEILTLADAIAKSTARTFAEALTLIETFSNQAQKTFSEALAIIDSVSLQRFFSKFLEETIVLADAISRQTSRAFIEAITIIDSAAKTTARALNEVILIMDTTAKTIYKNLQTEAIAIADALRFGFFKIFSEILTLTDAVQAAIGVAAISVGNFIIKGIYQTSYAIKNYFQTFTIYEKPRTTTLKEPKKDATLNESIRSATIRPNKPEP